MSDEVKTYNGWRNYETWAVALHLGNDQGTHACWCESAEDCYRDPVAADPDDAREDWTHAAAVALADRLKNEIDDEEVCPTLAGCTLYTDLLRAALGEVHWYEVATHYVEDIDRDGIEPEARDDAMHDAE
jgi:hypothetical protein